MAKILIVEDDTNLSEIYQARMEAEGYTVVAASDGEAALAVAAKERPDLIISDVMMPKISGFEMLDILRNTDGLKNTPVIMLTALGQADDKNRAEQLGASRYLVKSQVTLEDIVNAAHAMLEDESGAPAVVAAASAPTGPLTADPAPATAVTPVAIPPADDNGTTTAESTDDAPEASSPAPAADDTSSDSAVIQDAIDTDADATPSRGRGDYTGYTQRSFTSGRTTDGQATSAPAETTASPEESPLPDTAPDVTLPEESAPKDAVPAVAEPDSVTDKPAQPETTGIPDTPPTGDAAPAPHETANPLSAAVIDHKIVSGTIEKLLRKVTHHDKPADSNDDPKPAKRVVEPPVREPQPSLDELLAKEPMDTAGDMEDKERSSTDPNSIAL